MRGDVFGDEDWMAREVLYCIHSIKTAKKWGRRLGWRASVEGVGQFPVSAADASGCLGTVRMGSNKSENTSPLICVGLAIEMATLLFVNQSRNQLYWWDLHAVVALLCVNSQFPWLFPEHRRLVWIKNERYHFGRLKTERGKLQAIDGIPVHLFSVVWDFHVKS
jgi:hypothetical protein